MTPKQLSGDPIAVLRSTAWTSVLRAINSKLSVSYVLAKSILLQSVRMLAKYARLGGMSPQVVSRPGLRSRRKGGSDHDAMRGAREMIVRRLRAMAPQRNQSLAVSAGEQEPDDGLGLGA
jgi:hypothetical protein